MPRKQLDMRVVKPEVARKSGGMARPAAGKAISCPKGRGGPKAPARRKKGHGVDSKGRPIKPCPLCSGEARVEELGNPLFPMYMVKCRKCGTCTQSYDTEVWAVKRWNTRVGPRARNRKRGRGQIPGQLEFDFGFTGGAE